MIKYLKQNINPKGRKTGDCSTRAIANTLDISYEDALLLQFNEAKKHYYGLTNKETADAIMKHFGYEKQKQPRKFDNTKYTVNELDSVCSAAQLQEGVLVLVANHFTCVKGGTIRDIWDCGSKTVGNYWVKVGEPDSTVKCVEKVKRTVDGTPVASAKRRFCL